ncbi:hypothetical protein C8R45DRAFT_1109133 [Mycena sanguinolenta]|nr:hypothetical protein C8R45DRAFT_1109133 [Mycena sanguinolenta]
MEDLEATPRAYKGLKGLHAHLSLKAFARPDAWREWLMPPYECGGFSTFGAVTGATGHVFSQSPESSVRVTGSPFSWPFHDCFERSHGSPDLSIARTPSRLGVSDGALATRLSGWFPHLTGSTSDLSIAATIGGSLSNPYRWKKGSSAGAKTSLKAVRYLLDSDATPDRSTEEIWT